METEYEKEKFDSFKYLPSTVDVGCSGSGYTVQLPCSLVALVPQHWCPRATLWEGPSGSWGVFVSAPARVGRDLHSHEHSEPLARWLVVVSRFYWFSLLSWQTFSSLFGHWGQREGASSVGALGVSEEKASIAWPGKPLPLYPPLSISLRSHRRASTLLCILLYFTASIWSNLKDLQGLIPGFSELAHCAPVC